MSAAPVAPPTAPRRAGRGDHLRSVAPTDLVQVGHGRGVASGASPAVRTGPPRRPALAPTSRAQAWRRRVVAALVLASLVVLVVASLLALFGAPAADGPRLVPVAVATVVVEPGASLWDVAQAHAPAGTTTGAYVEALRAANGLEGNTVQAWQVLELPAP